MNILKFNIWLMIKLVSKFILCGFSLFGLEIDPGPYLAFSVTYTGFECKFSIIGVL